MNQRILVVIIAILLGFIGYLAFGRGDPCVKKEAIKREHTRYSAQYNDTLFMLNEMGERERRQYDAASFACQRSLLRSVR